LRSERAAGELWSAVERSVLFERSLDDDEPMLLELFDDPVLELVELFDEPVLPELFELLEYVDELVEPVEPVELGGLEVSFELVELMLPLALLPLVVGDALLLALEFEFVVSEPVDCMDDGAPERFEFVDEPFEFCEDCELVDVGLPASAPPPAWAIAAPIAASRAAAAAVALSCFWKVRMLGSPCRGGGPLAPRAVGVEPRSLFRQGGCPRTCKEMGLPRSGSGLFRTRVARQLRSERGARVDVSLDVFMLVDEPAVPDVLDEFDESFVLDVPVPEVDGAVVLVPAAGVDRADGPDWPGWPVRSVSGKVL